MRSAFEDEGEIRGVDLLAGFVSIWRRGECGALSFSRAGATARFDVRDAEIVAVGSSDPRYQTAAILVRAAKLSSEALERLSAPAGSDRALAALQAGLLTRREWRWGEKIRAIEVLSDLLTWLDGRYVFDRDARPEPADFALTVPRLILELFLRSRDRTLIHHYLGQADAPLVRAERFEEEFSSFGLTADAESVVRLIDGEASAEEICASAPADSFAVEKLLAALITLGIVRPAHAAVEPAQPVEPPPAPVEEPRELVPPEEVSAPEEPEPVAEPVAGASEAAPEEPVEPPPAAPSELEETRLEPPETESPVAGWEGLQRDPLDRTLEIPPEIEPSRPARSTAPLLWLLGLLLAAVAAVLYFRSRDRQEGAALPPGTRQAPAPAATFPAPTEAAAATVPTAVSAPTAAAQPTARPTAAPTARRQEASAERELPVAAAPNRAKWARRAERDARRARADRRARYTVQLELVCEIASLEDAARYDRPAGSMWVAAAQHGGRTCFRVLWGRYPTLEAARRAKERVPAFFTTPRNRPAVVGIRQSLLP